MLKILKQENYKRFYKSVNEKRLYPFIKKIRGTKPYNLIIFNKVIILSISRDKDR